MIDKIVVSQDRTYGMIYYTNREPIEMYHSEAKVVELILWLLTPTNIQLQDFTVKALISSLDDTAIIDLNDLKQVA